MRGALAATRIPLWPAAAAGVAMGVAYGLASSAQAETLALIALALAVALALWLPPHLFLAGSLAVLVTFQLSADRPLTVGGIRPFATGDIVLYSSDVLLALVALRAMAPRPRRRVGWRILDVPAAIAVGLWTLVVLAAAARGYLAGTPPQSVARLAEQLVYYPVLAWGFVRVLRERDVSSARVAKALVVTALGFVAYMGFERLTHQRFENPDSATGHLGSVVTAQGITLHRDYGFYSAYDLYGLAALGVIAYLLFARRSTRTLAVVAGILVAATALTLVRGVVFGLIVGVALLALLAFRARARSGRQGQRLVPLAGLLAVGIVVFWSVSPASAQGMAERFLPGIAAQSQTAARTAQYREQALSFGFHEASDHPFGDGLVTAVPTAQGLAEAGFLAHSAWATMLVYTGWAGILAFLSAVLLLVRRSFRLPDGPGWLRPFFLAACALLLVAAFGSDGIVGQTWVLGEAALVIGLRFGLADVDD